MSGGTVAHPKMKSLAGRSAMAVATAALMGGPLAAAGAAATLDTVTDTTGKVVELTCKEALATKDAKLIEEFCEPHEIPCLLYTSDAADE